MMFIPRNVGHTPKRRPLLSRSFKKKKIDPGESDSDNSNDDPREGDASSVFADEEDKSMIHFIRHSCGIIVNDSRTRIFITIIILVNSINMGVATYPLVRENPEVARAFAITDMVFLVIYTIECALQFIHRGFYMFTDGWLLFDFLIVCISWAFESISVIRAFRVIRSVRIFRAFRLVGRFKPIREVVMALLAVMPNLMFITILLGLTFYINTVFYTTLFQDMYKNGQTEIDYFSNLVVTSFTLFQVMCLDDWSEIAREVMQTYTWAWVPFIFFLIVTTFTVLNMFIAVFCKAVHELESIRNPNDYPDDNAPPSNVFEAFRDELIILTDQMRILSMSQDDAIQRINDLSWQIQAQKIRKKFLLNSETEANI